jgi:hypothetical protein
LPDVDLTVTALADGFTHLLVVKSAEAAENPDLVSIEMPVVTNGVTAETAAPEGLQIVDATTGDTWLTAGTPAMWDSTGVAEVLEAQPESTDSGAAEAAVAAEIAAGIGQNAAVAVSTDADSIDLVPDAELLTGADTVYPVYIDPVYKTELRTDWAMISSGENSDVEYWEWVNNERGEGVGRNPDDSSVVKRQLFRVPTSFYKGKKIVYAEFAVSVAHNWAWNDAASGHPVELDKISGFSSSTNWDNRPTSWTTIDTVNAPSPINGACKAPSNGASFAMEWVATSTLQSIANAGTSSLSLQVRNRDESNEENWIRICSNGQLRVQYNTAPDTPVASQMRSVPGGACQTTIDLDSYVNEPPSLWVWGYDDDHLLTNSWGGTTKVTESLKAQFYLSWTENGVAKTWSGWTATASARTELNLSLKTVANKPTLPQGVPITWKAKLSDNFSESGWSPIGRR